MIDKKRIDIAIPNYYYSLKVFNDLANSIKISLNNLNIKSSILIINSIEEIKNCRACFIFAPHQLRYQSLPKNNIKLICWQLEHLPTKYFKLNHNSIQKRNLTRFYKYYKFYDLILDFNRDHIEYLKELNIKNVDYLPICYHRNLEKLKNYPKKYKYDLIFFGWPTRRRTDLIRKIENKFNIIYFLSTKGVWGKNKIKLINQAKICLNIHKDENNSFDMFRTIQDYLCNKKFVISEVSNNTYPLINNKHLVACSYNRIIDKINTFISDDTKRKQIALEGYNFIKEKYSLEQRLLDIINKYQI